MNLEREEYDAFAPSTDEQPSEPLKANEIDGKQVVVGYPVVWGAISSIRRDGFRHQYMKGSITAAEVVNALWNHDLSSPLASTRNETLTVVPDDYGMLATINLDDTTASIDAYKRIKSGMVRGMSFGGTRISFVKTSDPKVIQVTQFLMDDVSVTIAPGMVETNVVTAEKAADLANDALVQRQKMKLDKIKLGMLRPVKV